MNQRACWSCLVLAMLLMLPVCAHASAALPTRGAGGLSTISAQASQPALPPSGQVAPPHKFSPNWAWMLPFVFMLGAIALAPLVHAEWWERRYHIVAAVLFAVGLVYYVFVRHDLRPWWAEMEEYVSFIVLLYALFVVSGGIVIDVSRKATPTANSVLLLTGAVIANIFGTTGAAMLLIRPYIRINRKHIKPFHICFFIFMVANAGGSLTPVGDPPLFLGYLKGVPFWWVFEHCWQPWLVANGLLLAVFFVLDTRDHGKAERHDWGAHDSGPTVRIRGMHNLLFIVIVIVAVFQISIFTAIEQLLHDGVTAAGVVQALFSREMLMIGAAVASRWATKAAIFEANAFSFRPIIEVAVLFLAIFSTMVPALEWLDANADRLSLTTPGQFYFTTGALSSVLDNAPTYLTFLQTRLGEVDPAQVAQAHAVLEQIHQTYQQHPEALLAVPTEVQSPAVRGAVGAMLKYHAGEVQSGVLNDAHIKVAFLIGIPAYNVFLVAISLGAVFFGACTYIGNAPNFMVKSIAESAGIEMPSFLGYVARYTLPILLPIYVIVWAIFFFGHG